MNRTAANRLTSIALVIVVGVLTGAVGLEANPGQNPLSLAEVLTALQSKSSGMSLSQKDAFITRRVKQRGVTFRLTPEIRSELRRVGASPALIEAISLNGPAGPPPPTPSPRTPAVKFDRAWTEKNVFEKSERGLRIHAKFTVYRLKDQSLSLSVRFQNADGSFLTTANTKFRNQTGQTAVFRSFTPAFSAAVFRDLSVFMPYSALRLPAGRHDLKLDIDLIYRSGDLLKHMTTAPFVYDNSAPSLTARRVKFERLWVDYNVRSGGLLGMRIHTKITIYNMKDESSYLAIAFERRNGERLYSSDPKYRSKNGQVTVYKKLTPKYPSTVYRDLQVFIPYSALNLTKGVHSLRMHADLIELDGTMITHVNYHNFKYTKK